MSPTANGPRTSLDRSNRAFVERVPIAATGDLLRFDAIRAIDRFVVAGKLYGEAYACNCMGVVLDVVEMDAPATADYTQYNHSIHSSRRIERHGIAARVIGKVADYKFLGRIDFGISARNGLAALQSRPVPSVSGEYEIARHVARRAWHRQLKFAIIGSLRPAATLAANRLYIGWMRFSARSPLSRQPVFQNAPTFDEPGLERDAAELATGTLFTRAQSVLQARRLAKDGSETRV